MPNIARSILACLIINLTAMGQTPVVRLITLDPGHFHAALVEKSMYADIDPVVHVYAPAGPDVQSHLDKINAYNTREKDPTHWVEKVYTGNDFLQKMTGDKAGNTVVLAGNNREKTSYILQSLQAGFHVLGDKPMVIDNQHFAMLRQAFDTAAANGRILYDIMTERDLVQWGAFPDQILDYTRDVKINSARHWTTELTLPQFTTLTHLDKFPGIELKKEGHRWEIIIPDHYKEGHEAHFARVTEKFLGFVKNHNMPDWEVPGMLAKYYTTTKALELACKTAAVAHPDTLVAQVATSISGSTRDLSLLSADLLTLKAGQGIADQGLDNDLLVIVRDGHLLAYSGTKYKTLGPGGIALFSAGDAALLKNEDTMTTRFYFFRFKSWSGKDRNRAQRAGPPFFLDWPEMPMKQTEKGESREIFSRPVAWLSRIDMHATTLNEGQFSHPPHIHRNEEIILLRSGNVQMFIGGKYYKAGPGDVVFLTSGTPHNLENKSKGRCEYFALQWQP